MQKHAATTESNIGSTSKKCPKMVKSMLKERELHPNIDLKYGSFLETANFSNFNNQITFKTFRHFKATMEYHRTKDIIHVMRLLGHKNIKNTLVYTQLVHFKKRRICFKGG